MIGNCEDLIFPPTDRDRAAVNLNDGAADLDLFWKLFMTLYDTQIAISCQNLQAILLGNLFSA